MDHSANDKPDANLNVPNSSAAPVEDDQLPPRAWLMRNGIYLLLFAGLGYFLYYKFGLDGTWNIVKAGLGLGFVIFIHELGHFAVAKWCDVHVQTFSIGFGPALPGCSFQYGETSYKLALFPLGGYVKMVGEGDTDPQAEEDPRSFKNKSVGQRMAIISAGVIMNVILAFVCFIIIFKHGKEREPAVVGAVDTGGVVYEKGIPSSAEFRRIGSREADPDNPQFFFAPKRPLYFTDLQSKVALSLSGPIPFVWRDWRDAPDGKVSDAKFYSADLEPRLGKDDLRPMIGLSPPESLQLALRSDLFVKNRPYPVDYRSPADAARSSAVFKPGDVIVATTDPDDPAAVVDVLDVQLDNPANQAGAYELSQYWQKTADKEITVWVRRGGKEEEIRVPAAHFEFGDTIIGTTDPEQPDKVTLIPNDPRYPGLERGDIFDYYRRLDRLAGHMVTIRVRRLSGQTEDLLVPPNYHVTLGVKMKMAPVASIRENSPATAAGIQIGDLLTEVRLRSAKGEKKFDNLDPVLLPEELRRWAEANRQEGVKVALVVMREGARKELPEVDWDFRWRSDRELPLNNPSPWPIPELGFCYRISTTVEDVIGPPGDAKGGLQKGDVIKAIQFQTMGDQWGESKTSDWIEIAGDHWARLFYVLQGAEFHQVTLRVDRGGTSSEVALTAQPMPSWPLADPGLMLRVQKVTQKADGILQALEFGLDDTWRGLTEVYLFLRGIILQRLSVKNLGGPITIARVAYRFAHMDFYEFLFFLGMISINLAAFNFLPIPVLDGGHMVFLVYEKLRGKPASEKVQWGATLVGLLVLGSLMIGVLILDVMKLL